MAPFAQSGGRFLSGSCLCADCSGDKQRQIIGIIGAAVLLCRDVFNMMPQATMFLVQTAIFARVAGSLPDEIPRRRTHLLLDIRIQVLGGL